MLLQRHERALTRLTATLSEVESVIAEHRQRDAQQVCATLTITGIGIGAGCSSSLLCSGPSTQQRSCA